MAAIDLELGNFVKDRYDFGTNPQVYHTNYFTRPEVANALTRWLKLPPVLEKIASKASDEPKRRTRTTRSGSTPHFPPPHSPSLKPLPIAVSYEKVLSPKIDTDIITINALSPVEFVKG